MPAAARRKPWFVIPIFLVLIGLGTWQVQRLQWKTALLADIESRMAADPIALSELLGAGVTGDTAYRPVRARGVFLHEHEFFLVTRTFKGRPGVHLVTPFAVTDGPVVAVLRGWLPDAAVDATTRPASRPVGETDLQGLVRMPPEPGWMTPDNDPATNTWFTIDPVAMGAAAGRELAPYFITATGPDDPSALPRPLPTELRIPNDHLGYAITWYSLAVAILVIGFIFSRQQKTPES